MSWIYRTCSAARIRPLAASLPLVLTMLVRYAPAQTLTTIYAFTGSLDGASPTQGVLIGKDGTLYGNTLAGGALANGTVFKLTPPATPADTWTESVLYSFAGGFDGSTPFGRLLADPQGALYGMTELGGVISGDATCNNGEGVLGCGTVFQLKPPAAPGGVWTETVLHRFAGSSYGDGQSPQLDWLTWGPQGVLYGTTPSGGDPCCGGNWGTIFQLIPTPPPSEGPWTETVLYAFPGNSFGSVPYAGMLRDAQGALYGTTYIGGTSDYGTVFEFTPPASPGGAWTETVLYSFTGGSDGGLPWAGLVWGPQGALYGTTRLGGTGGMPGGCGTAFQLKPPASPGGSWTETVLYNFMDGSDGCEPQGGLVWGPHGALYGTTQGAPGDNFGTVFQLTPPVSPGGAWTETVLHSFTAGSDGANPTGPLVVSSHGTLYGTTYGGTNTGTVFEVTP